MHWYHYPVCFFAGVFLANFVPHFVQGISGNKFPTPFSKPRGIGLSSSTVNMVWSLINLLVGFLLLQAGKEWSNGPVSYLLTFAGIAVMGMILSKRFTKKQRED